MKKTILLTVIAFSAFFTLFFYRHAIGLNILLFEIGVFATLFLMETIRLCNINTIIVFSGTVLTSIFVVITNSTLVIVINIISFYLLVGVIIFPEARSLLNSFLLASHNIAGSLISFTKLIFNARDKTSKSWKLIRKLRIIFIPALIIIVFIILYDFSNPVFEKYLNISLNTFDDIMTKIFSKINIELTFIYVFGLMISIFIFFHVKNDKVISRDINTSDLLTRRKKERRNRSFKFNALKNELRSGVILLFALNALILIINIIDIYWVWFNFEWDGKYLKQFVHEGTYLLILSVLISIAITLYFFRGNLNYYRKNKFLKTLSYIWLFQNIVLLISVAFRNFWYINYFSLAYKRIGIFCFLILTLYGILTVIVKIRNKKSSFFLFRANSFALYILLILVSVFNWDSIIARYNFSHYKTSFVHYDFLCSLSDKTLPYLDKSISELKEIDDIQKHLFPFEEKYMDIYNYYDAIQEQKKAFIERYEAKDFLEWNYAEFQAYHKLIKLNK